MGNLLSHVRFYDFSELAGVRYETLFDSIDGWIQDKGPGGVIGLGAGQVNMTGGTAVGDYAELQRFISFGHWQPTFNKKRLIRTQVEFSFKVGGDEDNYFGTGYKPVPGHGFGFILKSNKIQGYAGDDADITYADLITGLVAPWLEVFHLEALFYPGVRVEFKVGGVWKANISTTLPAGEDFSGLPLYFRVGKGGAIAHAMNFSSALFFQDQ